MAIVPITIYGDKILREPGKPVEKVDTDLIMKIRNMFDSMRNANGIGLAANQVGYSEKVFVIDVSVVEGYESIKPVAMINPEIILYSDEQIYMEEGCLSLPNLKADVERSKELKIRYLDTDENVREIEADDLFARVILHEYDHLIGKMIPDRVDQEVRRELQFELNDIVNRRAEADYPITEKSNRIFR